MAPASALLTALPATYVVSLCPLASCTLANIRHQLINLKSIVDNIGDRNRRYNTGQQIACTGSLCAFYQNGATGTANDASAQLQQLLDHHCTKCGSVPTQPGNDVSKGELTAKCVSVFTLLY